MIVAIHQPNYIPWLGYFRKVAQCDIFVFYDNVQMPMGKSYVTRCQLKSPGGARWLTVPTRNSGTPGTIREARVLPGNWKRKHLNSLRHWYAGSPDLRTVTDLLAVAFDEPSVADLNISIIESVARLLGIEVRFVRASTTEHGVTGAASIMPTLVELGATDYLSGSGAGSMRHLDTDRLADNGIKTRFLDTQFPEYAQGNGLFLPGLSVLDAILNLGPPGTREILG